MKLHLIDINMELCDAWEVAFADFPEVKIACDHILQRAHNCIVSPANSYGHMDGGIDQVYTDYFGDQLQLRFQHSIRKQYADGLLPVGCALLVESQDNRIPYVISAPTMVGPMIIPRSNVFFAMNAMLKCAVKHSNVVSDVFCPGLGTGVGHVAYEDAAFEMANAYRKQRERFFGE